VPLSLKVHHGYKNFYLYSCVAPLSGESFTLFLPEVNTDMMNIFFEELSREYPNREIIIALDQEGWHKAKDLTLPDTITLLFLPSYSPELNPIERLWQWLRKEVTHNALFYTLEDMMDALEHEIRCLTADRLAQLCHCSYL
jgi:transposase